MSTTKLKAGSKLKKRSRETAGFNEESPSLPPPSEEATFEVNSDESKSNDSVQKIKTKKSKKIRQAQVDDSNDGERNVHESDESESMLPASDTAKLKKKKKEKRNCDDGFNVPQDLADDSAQEAPATSTNMTDVGPKVASILSKRSFNELPIDPKIKEALKSLGFEFMTEIQDKSIPECLRGTDIVGAAKTGSGKTLSFLIPIVELLNKVQFTRKQGTGAIVISPTRELSLQIYGVLRDLIEATGFLQTHGLVIGGANRKAEADRLIKGVNILVSTPGRLLDHLMNTKAFNFQRLQMLVIDEADRILEQGFEEDMRQIIKLLPKERQTVLFSATQTRKVEDLARLSIQGTPLYVGVHDDSAVATVDGLQQGFVMCPADKRFLLLYTFLRKNKNKKIMVFFSSCNSVKFHSEIFNFIDLEVMDIHGKQKQQKRTTTFFQFCKQKEGILLCTDVAARGLDIPAVDWIVQYDPPDDPKEYIHRVGRTARGTNTQGRGLLFLLPEEVAFLKYLRLAKVTLQEYEFPVAKVANVGSQMTMLIEKNYYLNKSARDAYRAYLLSYASHSHKDIFNVHELDLQGVGRAFGFSVPPRVDLNFSARGDKMGRKKAGAPSGVKGKFGSSGHAFSAENPYGKRAEGDKRQFSR